MFDRLQRFWDHGKDHKPFLPLRKLDVPMPFVAQHIKSGRLHLQKSDKVMKRIIKSVGPFTAKTKRDRFLTLVQSIVSQQISGAAARTILERLIKAVGPDPICPEALLKFSVDQLREIGVSRQKASYVLDLSRNVEAQAVNLKRIGRLSDDDVISELTRVKGIGVWTAQMFLMFSLGRLNVFPDGDLGIQQAIKKNYELDGELTKAVMLRIAEPWKPYATIASWYLWRSLEVN